MTPSVYLYREIENNFELYLGGFSTLAALELLERDSLIHVKSIGASNYKNFGWTTENDFPKWDTVRALIDFFRKEGEFGLIDFKVSIIDFGCLSSHDDGECLFILDKKEDVIGLIKTVSENNQLIDLLLKNENKYIDFDERGDLRMHYSFEQYLKNVK